MAGWFTFDAQQITFSLIPLLKWYLIDYFKNQFLVTKRESSNLCTSVTHHQAQAQPPTTLIFLSEPPKQPPETTRASFGPEVWIFPMIQNTVKILLVTTHARRVWYR